MPRRSSRAATVADSTATRAANVAPPAAPPQQPPPAPAVPPATPGAGALTLEAFQALLAPLIASLPQQPPASHASPQPSTSAAPPPQPTASTSTAATRGKKRPAPSAPKAKRQATATTVSAPAPRPEFPPVADEEIAQVAEEEEVEEEDAEDPLRDAQRTIAELRKQLSQAKRVDKPLVNRSTSKRQPSATVARPPAEAGEAGAPTDQGDGDGAALDLSRDAGHPSMQDPYLESHRRPLQQELSSVLQAALHDPADPGNELREYEVYGSQLDPKLKKKIWEGQFIELGLLANAVPAAPLVVRDDASIALAQNKIKEPASPTEWHTLFATFMAVYLQKHPTEGPSMITYMDKIMLLYRQYNGYVWRSYDRRFRAAKAACPKLPWHMIRTSWVQDFARDEERAKQTSQYRRNQPFRGPPSQYRGNNLSYRPGSAQPRPPQHNGPKPICGQYNSAGGCHFTNCKFRHACKNCQKPGHPVQACKSRPVQAANAGQSS